MSNGETTQKLSDAQLYKYGFWVVVIGVAAIIAAFLVGLSQLTSSGDVATVASALFAAIGTLAGAYFGFHAGSAGKAGAEQAWQAAENARQVETLKVQRLAVLAAKNDADKADKVDEILQASPAQTNPT
jgi:hypothetical protein